MDQTQIGTQTSRTGEKPLNDQNISFRSDKGRHGVVAVVIEDGRFLVIRRSQFVRAPGLLCFPGGGIEEGEDYVTAMQREMMEELQLRITVKRHLWSSVTRWGTHLEWMLCSREAGCEPVPSPEEVSDVYWLTPDEILERDDLLGSIPDFFEALSLGKFHYGE